MATIGTGTSLPDLLFGTPDGDLLQGLGGADLLVGAAGNDRLIGGSGPDILVGGSGDNTFVFRPGDLVTATGLQNGYLGLVDAILDFHGAGVPAGDVLRFEGFSAVSSLTFDHFGSVPSLDAAGHVSLTPDQSLQYYHAVDPITPANDGYILVYSLDGQPLGADDYSFVPSTVETPIGLTGVVAPTTVTVESLESFPPTVLTATYTSGAGTVTDTYAGVPLWDLLQSAGGPVLDTTAKNDSLSHYIVATGSDGYSAVFSLGELDPRFGAEKVLVAYADTLGQLGPAGEDGYARIVASEDVAGGRYVSDLASLQVEAGPAFQQGPGGMTSAFSVSGEVAHPGSLGLDSLVQLGATTVSATYQAGGTPVSDTYTGVPLWDLLQNTGVLTDPAIKNDILDKVVVATGSDGYRVAFSLGELSPNFGHEQVLVAYADTAGQLGPGGADGFARLVVPGDTAGGRYVSNLTDLQVVDVVHQHELASTSVWG